MLENQVRRGKVMPVRKNGLEGLQGFECAVDRSPWWVVLDNTDGVS